MSSAMLFRIVALLLFIIAFSATVSFGARLGSYFFGDDTGVVLEESFELFENNREGGEVENFRLPSDHMILIMNPGADYSLNIPDLTLARQFRFLRQYTLKDIGRPSACEDDKTCFCICQSPQISRASATYDDCERLFCKSTDSYEIPSTISFHDDVFVDESFIIERTIEWSDSLALYERDLNERTIFFNYRNGILNVCVSSEDNCPMSEAGGGSGGGAR